jgi:uncharacterized protein (DUF1015 family)
MPRFEPFRGIRYDPERVALGAVIAPPYDVIDPEAAGALAARSPYNAVRLELPMGDERRYATAAGLLESWLAEGILRPDEEPAFYVYRMGCRDDAGRARQTAGVIGALGLVEGPILPHERTLPRARTDRLELLRHCRANLSPVWCLSLAEGLTGLCELPGPPVARATDDAGVHHRLWKVTQPGVVEAIAAAVAAAPVVIADGHHRFETALAYREERRAATGGRPGDYDLLMAYVVELAPDQLNVRPIHRVLDGLPEDLDLPAALAGAFEVFEGPSAPDALVARMADAGALGLWTPAGAWLLRPRDADPARTDAELVESALAGLPSHRVGHHHDVAAACALVEKGEAQAAVLLRAPTVAQIAAAAREGRRLPEKTSFFHPKPATGLVFRRVVD